MIRSIVRSLLLVLPDGRTVPATAAPSGNTATPGPRPRRGMPLLRALNPLRRRDR